MTGRSRRDTIFALSSGPAPAAIAIVRISGPAAGGIPKALGCGVPVPRRAALRSLRDADGLALDRALLLWFPGPATATGEDLLELHCHGGRATIAAVLAALAALPGLRAADPGEFTRRAFANGRIDLTRVEGLADLLAAETEGQRRQALRIAEGGLSALIERWRVALLECAATIEAAIEFGDEDGSIPPTDIRPDLAAIEREIAASLAAPPAERLRDGARIVVAGPVNAGKSTLVNTLAGRDVAIATPLPGTTRDIVEAPLVLAGMPCILVDTAGLRGTIDEVERIGVARAREAAETADIVLWLGPPDDAPAGRVIRVAACADLHPARETGSDIAVSSLTGAGIGDLLGLIVEHLRALAPREDRLVLAARHRALMENAAKALAGAQWTDDQVLQAASLAAALRAFDAITGRAGVEDMLDTLFGRFCIGK